MLRNYLKTALRKMWRQRGFSAINVLGLSLGLACCLIIGLYIQDEFSFDRYHQKGDRIFRVSQEVRNPDGEEIWAWTGGAVAEDMDVDFPDIEATVRFLPSSSTMQYDRGGQDIVSLREPDFGFVDEDWFEVFDHTFVRGDRATALANPNSLVITESSARRYFADRDPMGEVMTRNGFMDLIVTGVIEDVPVNSHNVFSMVAPTAAFKLTVGRTSEDLFGSYWWPTSYTYVLLRDSRDAVALNAALPSFSERHRSEAERYVPVLEPLREIHLFSQATGGPGVTGSIGVIRIFGTIALIVLLLACINFMNLATARSAGRSREVGVRKSLGAGRGQLVGQFLGEALLLSVISLIVAVGLVEFFLPTFNGIAGRVLNVDYGGSGSYWIGLLLLVGITGLLAGSYPAFFLSKMAPIQVLKADQAAKGGNVWIRKGLVVFQFSISVVLIASTLIAARQLDFLQNKRLGFDQAQTLRLRLPAGVDYDLLQAEFLARPEVLGVTSAQTPPGVGAGSILPYRSGPAANLDGERTGLIAHNQVDYDFVEQMELSLVAGRAFSIDRRTDIGIQPDNVENYHVYDRSFIVNQAAVRENGWTDEEAIGQKLRIFAEENGTYFTDLRGTVVGVLHDFHYRSLRTEIEPAAYSLAQTPSGHIGGFALLKMAPGNVNAAMTAVQTVWKQVASTQPFEATFLDDEIQQMYLREGRLGRIIGLFTLLGIVIACLGLVGLAAFAAERRTKEIGVRKVMGASVAGLIGLLSKDFLYLVGLAFLIGAPAAYLIMGRWLQAFAYHASVGIGVFLATGALAVVIALLSVGYQAWRAANANPIESLRYE